MINQESVTAVNASKLNERFGKPLYNSYCFSNIPQTIYHLLTGEGEPGLPTSALGSLPPRFDKVILLFVDAFGWRFFDHYCESYPFLKRIAEQGVVSKLTTQFPSTTAAHTTTIHSGLPISESGVFEWYYYEPVVDQIIAPLLFSFAGDKERNTLQKVNVSPQALYPPQNIYHKLKVRGVNSFTFQPRDIMPSPFSDVMCAGAKVTAYKTISEAVVNLVNAVNLEKERAYYFLYFDGIDSLGHTYGPGSPQFEGEVDSFFTMLERLLQPKLKDALLLITADHGQTEISPETTIYLNKQTPSIEPFIKRNRQGDLLVPGGSARDMFLYIEDSHLDEAYERLAEQVAGHADVFRTQELIEQGFFGPGKPSEVFLNRVGNLVILPYEHDSVWWYEKGRFSQHFYGHHGGLSRAEMETVLMALPY